MMNFNQGMRMLIDLFYTNTEFPILNKKDREENIEELIEQIYYENIILKNDKRRKK